MKTSHNEKCCDKTKPATEVPAHKKASSCDTGKDATCSDKKEKAVVNAAGCKV
jgi:hypothetical protein